MTIIGTLLGVILVWRHEDKRTKKKELNDRIKIMDSVMNELEDNLTMAEENSGLFASNIENLKQQKTWLQSPTFFHESGWRYAQANGIASFIDIEVYKFIAGTYITITHMNAQFNAREGFRITNMAQSSFYDVLILFDQMLHEKSVRNVDRIKETIARLQEAKNNLIPKSQRQKS